MRMDLPGRVKSQLFNPVIIAGNITLPAAVKATGTEDQSGGGGGTLIFTAKKYGTYGNGISVVLTDGGTAGSETVAVVDKVITVTIESGVSTDTQIKSAIDGEADAAALVAVSGNTAAAITAATDITVSLTGGAGDGANLPRGIASFLPTTVDGQYELILSESAVQGINCFMSVHADDASTSSVVCKAELMNADNFTADVLAKNPIEIHMLDYTGAEVVNSTDARLHLMLVFSESERDA